MLDGLFIFLQEVCDDAVYLLGECTASVLVKVVWYGSSPSVFIQAEPVFDSESYAPGAGIWKITDETSHLDEIDRSHTHTHTHIREICERLAKVSIVMTDCCQGLYHWT